MSGQDLGDLTTQQLLDDISQTLSDEQLAPPRTTVRPKLKSNSLNTNPCADMEKPIAVGSIQMKQYDDGGIYKGTFRNGLQHGTGTYTRPNGYQYSGDWVDGEIRGKGFASFPNGSRYEGCFFQRQA